MLTDPFAEAIAEAEKLIETAPHIRSEQDLLEGYQYLAGGIIATTHAAWAGEKTHPSFIQGTGPFTKMGLDNPPDTLYFGARINDDKEYKVTGKRGTTADLSFQVLSGNYTNSNVPGSEIAFDDRELEIDDDGNFVAWFGPPGPADGRANYYTLAPGSSQLVVREVYSDWSQQRGVIRIERTDSIGIAPPPLTAEETEKRYARAGKALVTRVKTWLQFPEWFYLKLTVNTMTEPRLTPGGLATQYSSVGHYELTDEQAMIITVPASDAPYLASNWGASGTSHWTTSIIRPPSTTARHRSIRTDGSNGGQREEPRCHQLDRNRRTSARHSAVPLAARVPRADAAGRSHRRNRRRRRYCEAPAAFRHQRHHRRGLGSTHCPAPGRHRQPNAGGVIMTALLEDRVVVISGVGPALGRALALRCASAGASLVLAARTQSRLDDVAKEIVDAGGRAVTVATDITDQASAENLVAESIAAYGKVDTLINNAFSIPSMKPLARTDYQHIRDSIELTVLGALRLTQLFTPALGESDGSVVNINSMVLRHSQERYGSYKMAKSALLAMSQSLATELGPQGIRVNSIAPAISGETPSRDTSRTRRRSSA